MDAESLTEQFGLGRPVGLPVVAASGWGERNRVWRLETTVGVFAVKDTMAELLPADPEEAFRIELLAHEQNVPSARPVPSLDGRCYERLDGRWYRCHQWLAGLPKQNEDTTPADAHAMGIVSAALHGLAIPAGPPAPASAFGRRHWLELAQSRPRTAWAVSIQRAIDHITASEALGRTFVDNGTIGTHRDLNAHNVLFTSDGPALIDWDGAGPLSATYERVSTAVLWAQRHDGGLDHDVARAFVHGYRDAGGVFAPDDIDALPEWLSGLAWWTERNVQIAIAHPSEQHDRLAAGLVEALAHGVATVRNRQRFLAEVLARAGQ